VCTILNVNAPQTQLHRNWY